MLLDRSIRRSLSALRTTAIADRGAFVATRETVGVISQRVRACTKVRRSDTFFLEAFLNRCKRSLFARESLERSRILLRIFCWGESRSPEDAYETMAARRDATQRARSLFRQRVSWNSVIYEKDLDSLARSGLLRVRSGKKKQNKKKGRGEKKKMKGKNRGDADSSKRDLGGRELDATR